MKRTYDVAYTLKGERQFEEFTSKSNAIKRALQLKDQGATTIFVDTFDEDMDLVEYKHY